jgi:hypothetical protein
MRTLALSALLCAACGLDSTGPVIDDVLPSSARRGDPVEIRGDRFCSDSKDEVQEDGRCATTIAAVVTIGTSEEPARATVASYLQTRISITVPHEAPGGATVILVTRQGNVSNAAAFEVLD